MRRVVLTRFVIGQTTARRILKNQHMSKKKKEKSHTMLIPRYKIVLCMFISFCLLLEKQTNQKHHHTSWKENIEWALQTRLTSSIISRKKHSWSEYRTYWNALIPRNVPFAWSQVAPVWNVTAIDLEIALDFELVLVDILNWHFSSNRRRGTPSGKQKWKGWRDILSNYEIGLFYSHWNVFCFFLPHFP